MLNRKILLTALVLTAAALPAFAQDTQVFNSANSKRTSAPLFLDNMINGARNAVTHPFSFGKQKQNAAASTPSFEELTARDEAANKANSSAELAKTAQIVAANNAQNEARKARERQVYEAQMAQATTSRVAVPAASTGGSVSNPDNRPMFYDKAKEEKRSHGPIFLQ